MKKFLLFILMLVPFAAQAEEVLVDNVYYNIDEDGDFATVSRISKQSSVSSVTIPFQVPKTFSNGYRLYYRVVGIDDNAFANANIVSVTLPNALKSIGTGAFSGCTDLTSITIPNSVSNIDANAFAGCI